LISAPYTGINPKNADVTVKKVFSPPRHQDTKVLSYWKKVFSWCLGVLVVRNGFFCEAIIDPFAKSRLTRAGGYPLIFQPTEKPGFPPSRE
jgi:hypothetical protein